RGVSGRDPVRDRHDQIRWHRDDLSVACVALADARDARADRKPRIAARVEHLARAAVAEGGVLLEPALDLRERRRDALAAGGLERLPDEIGTRPRLLHQRLRAEAGHRALGAGGDERMPDRDEREA